MLWCDDQEERRNRSPSWMEATEDAPVMLLGEHHARLLERYPARVVDLVGRSECAVDRCHLPEDWSDAR